jgi:hypothetical protein
MLTKGFYGKYCLPFHVVSSLVFFFFLFFSFSYNTKSQKAVESNCTLFQLSSQSYACLQK